jgi:hypothetical protein
MHLQIRTVPARSPASLVEFLGVLFDNDINLESAGGHDIEAGGEFVCAVAHGEEDRTMRILQDAGYRPRLVEVDVCAVGNTPGQLLECIASVTEQNQSLGRVIRDITVGVPDADGRLQVQIYSDAS